MTDDASRESVVLERIEAFRRRRPRLLEDVVTAAHGAGGKASAALIDAVFLEAFGSTELGTLEDSAIVEAGTGRLAFTTDSYVVKPLRFPGGSIGHLAVHGTVNDLAVMGAEPKWIAAGFVLEQGLPIDLLRSIVADMAEAAARAGVAIVAGDTKVVDRGAADGMYINTSGIGVVRPGTELGARHVQPSDRVLVSGPIGRHGVAVLLARGELALEADVTSDTAPLGDLVASLLTAAPGTRWLRDATRGGVATVCNELAQVAEMGIVLDEHRIPVPGPVSGACELLGIDPLYIANEGTLVAVVPADESASALAALHDHPLGHGARDIGEIVDDHHGMVVLATGFGGARVIDMLVGDPLPRIC